MSIGISSHHRIRQRAHEIFLERSRTGRKGDSISDWLEAEQEIRRQRIPVRARMLHFSELPLKLSGLLAHSPKSPASGIPFASRRNPVLL